MASKLTNSSSSILNKSFGGVPNGYDPFEVDEFLDSIIRDYHVIENHELVDQKQVDELKEKIKELEAMVSALEIENGKYKSRFSNIKASDNVTSDNIELVKKINRYEKFLFNHGFNPNTIK